MRVTEPTSRDARSGPTTRRALMAGREASTFDALGPVTGIGSFIYAMLTVLMLADLGSDGNEPWLMAYTAASATFLGLTWLALRSRLREVLRRHVVLCTVALALLVSTNPVVFMFVEGTAHPSVGMVLVIVAVGGLLHHPTAAWFVITACNAQWLTAAALLGVGDRPMVFFGELMMTNLVALALNVGRVRTVNRLEEARARASRLATTDSLTGLANHRAVIRRGQSELARARRTGQQCVVLYIDIDGLKLVNDTQGHAAGDELIVRAADALRSVVRTDELVGRVGGDEFVVVTSAQDDDQAKSLARRVRDAFAAEDMSASIGVAACTPNDEDFATLLGRADLAMYVDKMDRRS